MLAKLEEEFNKLDEERKDMITQGKISHPYIISTKYGMRFERMVVGQTLTEM